MGGQHQLLCGVSLARKATLSSCRRLTAAALLAIDERIHGTVGRRSLVPCKVRQCSVKLPQFPAKTLATLSTGNNTRVTTGYPLYLAPDASRRTHYRVLIAWTVFQNSAQSRIALSSLSNMMSGIITFITLSFPGRSQDLHAYWASYRPSVGLPRTRAAVSSREPLPVF